MTLDRRVITSISHEDHERFLRLCSDEMRTPANMLRIILLEWMSTKEAIERQ